MKHDKNINVKINALGYCAEGIGRVLEGENKDMTVFIENTTVGDVVGAEIFSVKKNYLRAKLTAIVEEGQARVKPKCPLAKVCGGCQWQHIDYQVQLDAKTTVIKDQISKISGIAPEVVKPAIAGDEIWEYRSKVQIPLGVTKNSKRLLAGYYKPKSHEIVNMKYCPVQPLIFDKIIAKLRELHKKHSLVIYDEKSCKGYLRHFVLRKSFLNDDILLTFVVNSSSVDSELEKLAEKLAEKFSQIKGITVNFNKNDTNVILGKDSQTIYGYDHIVESVGKWQYKISDRSFFQINPYATKAMFQLIYDLIQQKGNAKNLLDIYAGVAAISIYVSDLFENIVAIESEASAAINAEDNFKMNNVDNIEFINKTAVNGLKELSPDKHFDVVILDPPRSGCEKAVLDAISQKKCDTIIYASCNPATMARDIKILVENGYALKLIQPVDMFCHTFHVEAISLLEKNG